MDKFCVVVEENGYAPEIYCSFKTEREAVDYINKYAASFGYGAKVYLRIKL